MTINLPEHVLDELRAEGCCYQGCNNKKIWIETSYSDDGNDEVGETMLIFLCEDHAKELLLEIRTASDSERTMWIRNIVPITIIEVKQRFSLN